MRSLAAVLSAAGAAHVRPAPARIARRFGNGGLIYLLLIFVSYVVPLLLNSAFEIELGGLSSFGLSDRGAIGTYLTLWLVAMVPFLIGVGRFRAPVSAIVPRATRPALRLVAVVLTPIFIALKIRLIADGVYDVYAFDSGSMTGGVWSMSMSLSELAVYLFTLSVLIGDRKLSVCLFALLALNLLHGTRIFTVSAISVMLFYWLGTGRMRWKTAMAVVGIGVVVLLGSLFVFLQRSSVDLGGADRTELLQYLLSPVLYESVFSQLALIELSNGTHIVYQCGVVDLVSDIFSFIVPRVLNPEKDAQCLTYLAYLQPLGAMNGVFGTFAYLQWFSFLFFLLFGLLGRLLFQLGRQHVLPLSLFVYFMGDVTLRLLRDGPVFAMKFLSVALFSALMVHLVQTLIGPLGRRRQDSHALRRPGRSERASHEIAVHQG